MYFVQNIVKLIYIVLWLNFKLVKLTYTDVIGKHDIALILMCLSISYSSIVRQLGWKYCSLVIVSVTSNIVPFFVLMLAVCWLGERARLFDGIVLALQIICVLIIMFGAQEGANNGMNATFFIQMIVYCLLFSSAFATAINSIGFRVMSDFHTSVFMWYSSWSSLIVSGLFILISGQYLTYLHENFTTFDWSMVVFSALTANASLYCRSKAYGASNPAKLNLLLPTSTFIAFLSDLMIFSVDYSTWQDIGLFVLIGLTFLQAAEYLYWQKAPEEQKKKIKGIIPIRGSKGSFGEPTMETMEDDDEDAEDFRRVARPWFACVDGYVAGEGFEWLSPEERSIEPMVTRKQPAKSMFVKRGRILEDKDDESGSLEMGLLSRDDF